MLLALPILYYVSHSERRHTEREQRAETATHIHRHPTGTQTENRLTVFVTFLLADAPTAVVGGLFSIGLVASRHREASEPTAKQLHNTAAWRGPQPCTSVPPPSSPPRRRQPHSAVLRRLRRWRPLRWWWWWWPAAGKAACARQGTRAGRERPARR